MSTPDEQKLTLDEAARLAEESRRRAEAEREQARERARWALSLARRLRKLREDNGFGPLMEDAFGGGRG
ncbi:DUF7620 family protein [Streptosporangium jomthongense]